MDFYNLNKQQLATATYNGKHLLVLAGAGCRCMDCFDDRFEWNEDKSYVRCKVCGREYLGGYNELVDLNRKYMAKNGIDIYRQDIYKSIKYEL